MLPRFRVGLIVLTLSAMALSSVAAMAAKRVALVIGNDTYETLPALNNARTDAKGMAAKLRTLGFEVILKLDARSRTMGRALAEFEGKAANADVALVFYAGHGIQAGGQNYLVPSDAQIEVEEDLRFEGIGSDEFLQTMKNAGADLNIVILDACRDNPLPKRSRSAARGLTVTPTPAGISGTAIVYSAAPGQTAQDGEKGGYGVFTGELLKVLDRPGLKLEEVFKQTAKQVASVTNGKQKPWINSSLTGDFYFRSGETAGTPAVTPALVPTGQSAELLFWESIKDSKNPASFEAYLSQYPSGAFVRLARVKLSELETKQTASLTPPSFVVEEIEETYVTLKAANVRSAPTTQAAKVDRLSAGTSVEVTGQAKVAGRPWWRVALGGGKTGFVWGPLLGPKVAAVTPPKVRVPSPATPAVGVYPKRYKPGDTFKDCGDCPEMVVISPGRFRMGDLSGGGEKDENPVHDVRIDYSFAVGKFEVTQDDWASVMGSNPSGFKGGRNPVEKVSWDDAKAFVQKLSSKTGKRYRLLSESEWEYVARAGTNSAFHTGATITPDQANYDGNYSYAGGPKGVFREKSVAVGSFGANSFGVHDMHGNVWEWVEDCWHGRYAGAPSDGSSWVSGGACSQRVLRGGSWNNKPRFLRAAFRFWNSFDKRSSIIGFRIARTLLR